MTALEVYEAFYDSANNSDRLIADFNGNEVEAIKAYADGAFDIILADETAEAIAKAGKQFRDYDGGEWTQKYWELVEKPLGELEVQEAQWLGANEIEFR